MADQAGIELILSAPNVKGIMDDVIDDWKEISRREKEATEQLERYNAELQKQLAQMKEHALGNQKIKDAFKELEQIQKEQADAAAFQAENGKKGIFGTIKAYFQQKAELKSLGKEIDSVNDQLRKLDLRQQAISLSARRGNTAAIKEYDANAKAIQKLSGSLNELNEKYNVTGAKLELTKGKFAGLAKGFAIVSSAAAATVAAVALIGIAAFAVIVRLGRMNDQVKNQFEKTNEAFKKAKLDLSDAFAPVAYSFGKVFEGIGKSLSDFIEKNQEGIFKWASNVGATIYALGKSLPFAFKGITKLFEKLTADVEYSFQLIQSTVNVGVNPFSLLDELKKVEDARQKIIGLKEELDSARDVTSLIFRGSFIAFTEDMKKKGLAFFQTRNQILKHKEALVSLTNEYKRLSAEINKQIQDLDVKEAGAFAGVILKAELAAKAIEETGKLAVYEAGLLHKSQAEIDDIIRKTARLSEAIRKDAVSFLNSEADTLLEEVLKNLRDAKARNNNSENELKFARELDDQFKKLKLAESILAPIIQSARKEIALAREEGRDTNKGIIEDGEKALTKLSVTAKNLSQLTSLTALDFFKGKAKEFYDELAASTDKAINDLKAKGEKLDSLLQTGLLTSDQRKEVIISVKANDIDLAVALEKLKQIDEALRLFKETGVTGVVQTDAVIRVRVEQQLGGIQGIQPAANEPTGGETNPNPGVPATKIAEALNAVVALHDIAYGAINEIVLNSIDTQIEAIDRLVQFRNDAVDQLQKQLDLEASFKENGLANDYDLLKKRLADETKLRDDAQKKALDLAAKRVKTQQALDTASQVSSIVTAIANVFASTTLGIPFAVPLAIAQTVALLAAFAASKIQANKLARAYKGSSRVGQTFGMMAPGEGYDDSPGVDRGLSVVDSRGRLRGYLGGEEYLNKQSVSKKHRSALDYLNNNESKFQNVNILAMLKTLEASPIKPVFELPDMATVPKVDFARIVAKNERLRERMVVVGHNSMNEQAVEKAVEKAMKKQTDAILEYLESRPSIVPNEWLRDYSEINSKTTKRFKKG